MSLPRPSWHWYIDIQGTISTDKLACFVARLVLCCCLIPFFLKHFKDAYHTCPRCQRVLYVDKKKCCSWPPSWLWTSWQWLCGVLGSFDSLGVERDTLLLSVFSIGKMNWVMGYQGLWLVSMSSPLTASVPLFSRVKRRLAIHCTGYFYLHNTYRPLIRWWRPCLHWQRALLRLCNSKTVILNVLIYLH